MGVSTAVRPGHAGPSGSARVAILDSGGRPLTHATATFLPEQAVIDGHEIEAPGALLEYRFGRGGCVVIVDADGTRLRGSIETAWDGSSRRWWVEDAASDSPRRGL